MERATWIVKGLGLLVVGVLSLGIVHAQGGKNPTIKEIMGKLHKGENSLLTTVKADLQSETPDWAELQRASKSFVALGGSLMKNPPPKGDKQSWTKLTSQYLDNAKSLDLAAQMKNKAAAIAAHTQLNDSCKGCHSVHRPG